MNTIDFVISVGPEFGRTGKRHFLLYFDKCQNDQRNAARVVLYQGCMPSDCTPQLTNGRSGFFMQSVADIGLEATLRCECRPLVHFDDEVSVGGANKGAPLPATATPRSAHQPTQLFPLNTRLKLFYCPVYIHGDGGMLAVNRAAMR